MADPRLNWSWCPADIHAIRVDAIAALGQLGGRFFNIPPYHDEPKLFHIASILPSEVKAEGLTRAGGSSWDLERAGIKALGETIERLSALDSANVTQSRRYASFGALNSDALDPQLYRLSRAKHRPAQEDLLTWIPGCQISPRGNRPSWVPAQLVFLPYIPRTGEVLWFQPTSNGLAAGQTVEHACWNAIMELLERDALLSFWFGGRSASRIDHQSKYDPVWRNLHDVSRRYQLEPEYYLLQSAVPGVFNVMCVLRDATGIGPTATIGLKTSHQVGDAMRGALEEAHQLRPWLRELQEQGEAAPPVIRTIEDRAQWWISGEAVPTLDDKLAGLALTQLDDLTKADGDINLGDLVSALSVQGHLVWLVELCQVVSSHVSVRAIVPTLQPAYFDETHPAVLSRNDVNHAMTVPRHPLL
jgi:thiazole/oxazole-forming peptide maturase SagD family component